MYQNDLLAPDTCRPQGDCTHLILSRIVSTPLHVGIWSQELSNHPDKIYTQYILQGIKNGFRIGFDRGQYIYSASGNLRVEKPEVVSDYLNREVSLKRMWKVPVTVCPKEVHISPMGIIPKKNKPNKWRLIVDLSSPEGTSINDGIDPKRSSLTYASIDHLSALVVSEGRGSFMVKADIKEAYQMVPVHPVDQHLLGVQWGDFIFIDKMLPFGLRSAPKIFSALADAIQWILYSRGIKKSLHYLDDFILVSKDQSSAALQKELLITNFQRLGVPIEESKLEGPSSCLTFLGIEVDTIALQLRLPQEKLVNLKELLGYNVFRKSITKKDLQKLAGLLQFATKVVQPGRPFLRRLYAMQEIGSHPNHFIRLNLPARADIMWWFMFVEQWNGVSLLWDIGLHDSDLTVYSDASGSWGCGAFCEHCWFQLEWPPRLSPLSIAVKEMFPVIIAAACFGRQWSGKVIEFVVDNEAVVEVLKATYSRDLHLMHLIRLLVFFASKYDFWFKASHIPGRLNKAADALSRNNLSVFFQQAPQADTNPSHIPLSLVSLLSQNITWTSECWIKLFKDTLQQV